MEHTIIIDDFGKFEIGYDQSSYRATQKWSYTLSQSERPRLEALVEKTTMEKIFTVNGRDGVKGK